MFVELIEECVRKDGFKVFEKDCDEKKWVIDKDKIDCEVLIFKGDEECVRCYE